jgi:isoleucyl-tRNA synthetase
MPFEKVETQVDFPAQERKTLEFWQANAIFDKLRAKNRGGPCWSFLDGPITANNPMGVHHAWGRTYKDAFQRFHAMLGHDQRYQNGFDCQGLWVEVEVEKERKFRSKRDIENLVPGDPFASIDLFVRLCKERVDRFARVQTEQSIRLGYWMDWDRDEDWAKPPGQRRSYFTMSEENNFTIWAFLKRCHNRGLIYRGYDAMPWCPRCSVGLAQMEMAEGYQLVAHRAVFVRFPLRGRKDENLLVWTTTPWTLTSNVGAAVNPQLTYLKILHKGQVYYLAKGAFTAQRREEEFVRKEWVEGVPKLKTLEQVFKEKGGYEVVGEVPGSELVGLAYDGPFDELPAQGHAGGFPEELCRVVKKQGWAPEKPAREVHRVIPWADVGETEGTGIVHIAPGCGREDFELGKDQGLPPVAPLDEFGVFLPGFGFLEGCAANDHATTDKILDALRQKDLLVAVEKYPHSYPHCWRCKTELLFRLVDEWFINMSWRDEIKEVVKQIRWLPEAINGQARELDWLTNMGDWMISKKRFWGLALPIWVDEETDDFEVIGSRAELKERAVEGWDKFDGHSPHRPWVDLIKIKNPKTGNLMSRIPDVGNPWLDAGIVPYSTMGYNTDRKYWETWFPADFITESFPGQFRNWFYALLAMSTMMENWPPFRTVLGHATVRDQWGEEMHKSKGNSIPFDGAADGEKLKDGTVGYKIVHILKQGEKPEAPGARSVEVITEEREGRKVKEVVAECPPMSADLIRWMFCRQNPATNINFGPGPAKEVHSKFFSKLWNSYSFLSTYAFFDGFDPEQPEVPLAERSDLDRWILSDLQKLINLARKSFADYHLVPFCMEAEKFVDDKLSNWYVRRNKQRFWSKNEELDEAQKRDKLAAYQTLYTVLTTLSRLLAPAVPFLCEEIYRNLEAWRPGRPASVHLNPYPEADGALIDEQLSADMEALAKLVTLGSAARNSVKIRVRQPLAEMKVRPGDESAVRAVGRFADLIRDELNVKTVTLHEPSAGSLFATRVKPNRAAMGREFGPRLREVEAALAGANGEEMVQKLSAGEAFDLGGITLEPEHVTLEREAPDGWAGAADGETQVIVDTRITEELAAEGMARDVVRHVQQLRKAAQLEMNDRIELYLETPSERLQWAIEAHREYVARETQVARWVDGPLSGGHRANVKVEKQALRIELRKADQE